MNETLSKRIRDLRFPLAAMIVFKHYYTPDVSAEIMLGGGEENFYFYMGNTITHVITNIVVPLFFFISGYLYFIKTDIRQGLSGINYFEKTKRRVKSLLIPYLSWNIIVLLLFGVMQMFTAGDDVMSKDGYKALTDYTLMDVWKAVYALDSTGMPIDGPLWFVRDLFVISLLSPIVFLLVKYLKLVAVLLLGVCLFCGLRNPIAGLSITCCFYFTWGTYMGLNKMDLFSNISRKVSIGLNIAIVALMAMATMSYFTDFHVHVFGVVYTLGSVKLVFGAMVVYYSREESEKKGVVLTFLSASSFFIFAIHKPIQVMVRRFGVRLLHPNTDLMCCVMNIVVPTVTILIALTLFYVVKRYLPYLKFLNGYRL